MNKEEMIKSDMDCNLEEILGDEIDCFVVDEESKNLRLDVFLSGKYEDFSRSFIQKMIKEDLILVNSKKEKSSYKLCIDDEIILKKPREEKLEIVPEDIYLDIVYEDDDIVVVNKPKGMVVHPAPGNHTQTLVNALKYKYGENLSDINGCIRPGIVHRIDKDTSGLLVIAKNNEAHIGLAKQFFDHSIDREYEMICIGSFDDNITVDENIGRNPKNRMKRAVVKEGGKRAVTHFFPLSSNSGYSYVKAKLETGRTHQIRVHSMYIGHPLLGDEMYGYRIKKFSNLQGQTLHARKLGFIHPITGKHLIFDSELPEYFSALLKKLDL